MPRPWKEIKTCEQEISNILHCWVHRIESCLDFSERVPFANVLSQQGLDLSELGGDTLLTHRQWDALTGALKRHSPDIVLRFLSTAELSDLGIYGYAIASTNTLKEAIELTNNVHFLTAERQTQELGTRGREAILSPRLLMRSGSYPDIAEDTLGGSWRLLKLLLGPQFDAQKVTARFSYNAPSYSASYDEVFEGRCLFGQANTEIGFPTTWLAYPLTPMALGKDGGLSSGFVERVLGGEMSRGHDIVSIVKRLLLSRVDRRFPTLDEAADKLNLSVSQLRHQLYRANTSYKRVVLDIRMTLAFHYLKRTDFDVQKIAFLLDYSEAAAFSRSFKKCYGAAPQLWREAAA